MCRFHISFIVLLVTTIVNGQLNLNLENIRYGLLLRSPQRGLSPVSPYSPASIQIQNRIRSLACELSNNEICPNGGSTQQSCENAGCCWHQHSGNMFGYYSRNGWCYKRASVNDVTTALMRQYRFQLPGFQNPFQRYMAVKDYVHCTLSKPVTTYIISIDDCKAVQTTTTHAPITVHTTPACNHHQWSGWSACTQACKETVMTRNRKCSCAKQDMCVGAATETMACNTPTVHDCGYWTSWTAYGSCSASCFQGVQVRTRNCEGGTAGQGSCQGPASESKPCHGTAQSYMQFGEWGQCSVTCGDGTHTRVAHSQCGQADKVETKPCQMPTCCGKLNWGPWSSCAHNNGRYIRARSRADKCQMIPIESEVQECQPVNTQAPPAYYYPQTQLYIHQRLHHNVPLPGQPQPNHGHLHNAPTHHNAIPLPGHSGAQSAPQQPHVVHNVHQPSYVVPLPVNQPLNKIPYPESLNSHDRPLGAREPIYVVPNQSEPTQSDTSEQSREIVKLLEQQKRLQQLIAEKRYAEAFEYQQSLQNSYGIVR